MAIDSPSPVDGALILEAVADVLDRLPPLVEPGENQERLEVAQACREAANAIAAAVGTSEGYAAARGYGGGEWRNAVVRSILGREGAVQLLSE